MATGWPVAGTTGRSGIGNAAEPYDFVLEPDTMLPEQFHQLLRRGWTSDPNKRLAMAVFEDALEIVASRRPGRLAERERALTWAWIRDDRNRGVYSFRWLCQVFDFDPIAVRSMLIRTYYKK